jgi:phosphatidylglycerol:prolipoprotein diacylglycerol transferase
VAYPIMRRYGYRFLQVMDSAAIGLAFGIFIGRIGDLVIGDHLGKPTDFFLGWAYRGGQLPGPWFETAPGEWVARLAGGFTQTLSRGGATLLDGSGEVVATGAGVHQTALYDFLIALGVFLFLMWLNRRPRREGVLIMSFAIWYGLGRVVTDLLRIDKTFFGLTGSQWTSVAAVAISVVMLVRFARRPLPADEEPAPVAAGSPDGEERTTDFTPPPEPGGSQRR